MTFHYKFATDATEVSFLESSAIVQFGAPAPMIGGIVYWLARPRNMESAPAQRPGRYLAGLQSVIFSIAAMCRVWNTINHRNNCPQTLSLDVNILQRGIRYEGEGWRSAKASKQKRTEK